MRNPKLLGLIRKGCSITFPSGVIFHRIPDSEFLESGFADGNDYDDANVFDLTELGLEQALKYEEVCAENLEDDEELEIEQREEEM